MLSLDLPLVSALVLEHVVLVVFIVRTNHDGPQSSQSKRHVACHTGYTTFSIFNKNMYTSQLHRYSPKCFMNASLYKLSRCKMSRYMDYSGLGLSATLQGSCHDTHIYMRYSTRPLSFSTMLQAPPPDMDFNTKTSPMMGVADTDKAFTQ